MSYNRLVKRRPQSLGTQGPGSLAFSPGFGTEQAMYAHSRRYGRSGTWNPEISSSNKVTDPCHTQTEPT